MIYSRIRNVIQSLIHPHPVPHRAADVQRFTFSVSPLPGYLIREPLKRGWKREGGQRTRGNRCSLLLVPPSSLASPTNPFAAASFRAANNDPSARNSYRAISAIASVFFPASCSLLDSFGFLSSSSFLVFLCSFLRSRAFWLAAERRRWRPRKCHSRASHTENERYYGGTKTSSII